MSEKQLPPQTDRYTQPPLGPEWMWPQPEYTQLAIDREAVNAWSEEDSGIGRGEDLPTKLLKGLEPTYGEVADEQGRRPPTPYEGGK